MRLVTYRARTATYGQSPRRRALLLLVLLLALALALGACADDDGGDSGGGEEAAGDWEPEEDIRWIVTYSPGGGFDTYSRGLAEFLQANHTPDGVNVAVENVEPVQQGITEIYQAEPDGYTVGLLPMPAAVAQQLQFPEVSEWETSEFTVLGSVDENAYVVYVPADSPYETIDDLIEGEDLISLTVERGSSSSLAAIATIEALDLDAELTYGAEGSQEVATAAIRGDADFFVYGSSDVVGFVDSGDVRPLLFLGTEDQRSDELEWLQDVPSAEDAGFPEASGTVTELRAIVGPPDMPEGVSGYLSSALEDTMADEEFVDWAAENERPIVPRGPEQARDALEAQISAMETLIPELADELEE